jgi:hypothetical protein
MELSAGKDDHEDFERLLREGNSGWCAALCGKKRLVGAVK